jgi:cyclic pyranopterin phosphate synthase
MPTFDQLARPLRDLRVSVTDRCNFRCRYCMPREVFGEGYEFLSRRAILRFEEIHRITRLAAGLGVRKVRITGGEPLLRRDLPQLVRMLAQIEVQEGDGPALAGSRAAHPGAGMVHPVGGRRRHSALRRPEAAGGTESAARRRLEIALTTNGALLARHAEALAEAGLDRVTVSLDSLDETTFQRMNDADFAVAEVLEGIEAAAAAGLGPVKINAVVQRGVNDDGVVELARHFKGSGHIVRFIEFMDVGTTNSWRPGEVLSGAEIVERITKELPAEPIDPAYRGEVARRWRYADGNGEFGVITSVSQPFCGDCTRLRLSAEGTFYTCLFASNGTDVRDAMRSGASDDTLRELISGVWRAREDRYSELRKEGEAAERIEMSYIGG